MNLEEFVKATLLDITRAVKNANIELSKEYGETDADTVAYYRLTESEKHDDIAFDVAVTAAT